jgi:hypothetical protein
MVGLVPVGDCHQSTANQASLSLEKKDFPLTCNHLQFYSLQQCDLEEKKKEEQRSGSGCQDSHILILGFPRFSRDNKYIQNAPLESRPTVAILDKLNA